MTSSLTIVSRPGNLLPMLLVPAAAIGFYMASAPLAHGVIDFYKAVTAPRIVIVTAPAIPAPTPASAPQHIERPIVKVPHPQPLRVRPEFRQPRAPAPDLSHEPMPFESILGALLSGGGMPMRPHGLMPGGFGHLGYFGGFGHFSGFGRHRF